MKTYASYYTNTQCLKEQCALLDGKLHGNYFRYSQCGKLIEKLHYQAGQLHGICRIYDKEGQLKQLARYRNGWLNGRMLIYQDGQLHAIIPFVAGKKSGVMLIIDDERNVISKLQFKDDKQLDNAIVRVS